MGRWTRPAGVVMVAILIAGCTGAGSGDEQGGSAGGTQPSLTEAATPAPPTTPAFRIPAAPGPDSATLALATFDPSSGGEGTSSALAVDPSDSYVVQAQCLADSPGRSVGYSVLVDDEPVSSGQVACDGGIYRDSAVTGTGQEAQFSIRLDATTGISQAYAALVPE